MKMFKDEYQSVCNAAKGKLGLLEKSPLGYFVSSIVAGMFIALGGFVTFTLGAHLTAAGCTITKPIMVERNALSGCFVSMPMITVKPKTHSQKYS